MTVLQRGIRDFSRAIFDRIWNQGHTPRIFVDASHLDVDIPEFVRRKWGSKFVVDLVATYPLDLDYGDDALRMTLAFSGTQHRCVIPWDRVYVIVDRETGKGHQIGAVPEAALEDPPKAVESPKVVRKASPPRANPFRVIKGGKA